MPKGKEFWSRDFARRYGHAALVADKDKYLFATEAPKYRFNVIGAGTMGQEHIRVTNFEGRGRINGVYDPETLSVENARAAHALYSDEPLRVFASLQEALRGSGRGWAHYLYAKLHAHRCRAYRREIR